METPDFKKLLLAMDEAIAWLDWVEIPGGTPNQVRLVKDSRDALGEARVWVRDLEYETDEDGGAGL